jgi:TolB-like protein/DNA-binding winged helix-turn-helix (wHTH) protein
MPTSDSRETFRFSDFELDVANCELRRQGRPIRLERRPMDLLILLVERRFQLVSRSDIVERLWGKDVFVDVETGVNAAISKVRQALRDSPDAPTFVETVVGRGYRFIAPVELGTPLPDSSSPPAIVPANQSAAAALTGEATDAAPASPAHRSRVPGRARVTVGLVALGLLAGGVLWAWRSARAPVSQVTLAVLPFDNLSGDPEREYLADGLAEETIASLWQVDPEHVSVIGRTSTRAYKRTTKSLAEIGRELSADYLVESSIRAESGHLRITSKLIRVRDQVQVWSASFDREPTSILGLQRELSTAIAEQIRLRLSPDRLDALTRRQTRNADAYDLYLRGRYFWNQFTPATNKRAVEYYQRAVDLDPNYALAWSGLADVFVGSTINSDVLPGQMAPRAREAAANAVRAQPDLAEAQTSLGHVDFFLNWQWPAAEAAFRRAIASDAGYAVAHRMLGHVLSQMGRHDEAQAAMRRARELDPLHPINHAISAQVAYQARNYSAALEYAQQAIIVDPGFWIGYVQQGQIYEQLGQPDRGLEDVTKAGRFLVGNSMTVAIKGYLLAKLGRASEAHDVLKTLEGVSRERYVPPSALALVHAGLGDRDAVFEWLDKAYAARDVHLIFLPVDPKWDPYRADPRFEAMLARCGFTLGTKHQGLR